MGQSPSHSSGGAADGCCCTNRSTAESTGLTPRVIDPPDRREHLTKVLQKGAAADKTAQGPAAVPTPARNTTAGRGWLGVLPLSGGPFSKKAGNEAHERNEPDAEATPNALVAPHQLPSVGSAKHFEGGCKRCCFFSKNRCLNGSACEFCHFEHEKRKRNKRKNKQVEKDAAAQGKADQDHLKSARGSVDDSDSESCPEMECAGAGPGAGTTSFPDTPETTHFESARGAGKKPHGGPKYPDWTYRMPNESRHPQATYVTVPVGYNSNGPVHTVPAATIAYQNQQQWADGYQGGHSDTTRDWQQPAFVQHSEYPSQWVAQGQFIQQGDMTQHGSHYDQTSWDGNNGYDLGLGAVCWSVAVPHPAEGFAMADVQQVQPAAQGFRPAFACTTGVPRPVLLPPGVEPIVETEPPPMAPVAVEAYGAPGRGYVVQPHQIICSR